MKVSRLGRLGASLLFGSCMLASMPAQAQAAYPVKPVKLLVGYGAGGGTDAMARILAQRLSTALGQQVVVENKAGAAGLVAAETVARSAPDGHTLLIGNTTLLIMPFIRPTTNSDLIRSLRQVSGVAVAPLMIAAHPSVPANTPQELAALLKANPGKYAYGTPGVGSVQSVGFEMLLDKLGAEVLHVPYSGAAQVVTDVVGGQVPLGVVSIASALPHLKAGRLKSLGSLGDTRLPGLENMAVLSDLVPGYDVAERLTLMTPAGTPPEVIEILNREAKRILAEPEVAEVAARQGMAPLYIPAQELDAFLARQIGELEATIKQKKIFVN